MHISIDGIKTKQYNECFWSNWRGRFIIFFIIKQSGVSPTTGSINEPWQIFDSLPSFPQPKEMTIPKYSEKKTGFFYILLLYLFILELLINTFDGEDAFLEACNSYLCHDGYFSFIFKISYNYRPSFPNLSLPSNEKDKERSRQLKYGIRNVSENNTDSQQTEPSQSIDRHEDASEEYIVEDIVQSKYDVSKKSFIFKTKWEGYQSLFHYILFLLFIIFRVHLGNA